MKTLEGNIANVSSYLQSLTTPNVYPKIQNAVEKKDRKLLIKVCRNAKIPERYLPIVVSVLLAVAPQQKWPASY
jgi:hypothetical protein